MVLPVFEKQDMCGIFTCIYCSREQPLGCLKAEILEKLKRRGPDHMGEVTLQVSKDVSLNMVGTLLHMRGKQPALQPLRSSCSCSCVPSCSGNYLLWNGNIFGGALQIGEHQNDTVLLLEQLTKCSDPSHILTTLSNVHGPWAFVFWQESSKSFWFGRDVFGRRSLLWHLPISADSKDVFCLSSVGHYHPDSMPLGYWAEVPAIGVYQLLIEDFASMKGNLLCYPWMQGDVLFQSESGVLEAFSSLKTCLNIVRRENMQLQVPFPPMNKCLPHPEIKTMEERADDSAESSKHSTETVKPVLDLEHDKVCTLKPRYLIPDSENQFQNVGTSDIDWTSLSQQLIKVLERAIFSRVKSAPEINPLSKQKVIKVQLKTSTACAESDSEKGSGVSAADIATADEAGCIGQGEMLVQGNARIAVLFSGGVDSVVLAALTDRCLDATEEIDLINVAFEQQTQSSSNFEVPDRISAISSLKELNPHRKWNMIFVNVTADEVNSMRRERVSHLVYPLCTVLDDSIGCALWFAARGEGVLYHDSPTSSPDVCYRSQARTLLVGIGADEQLAGYSRHRARFRSVGWQGLIDEVEMDIKRLAKRNLGRDDRCIADHQREGQFPFLDEDVLTFLQQIPMCNKTDLSLPRGVGEKRILREAAVILGCTSASALPKRAIQFGSRMAKLAGTSNSRELGSDVCERLLPCRELSLGDS